MLLWSEMMVFVFQPKLLFIEGAFLNDFIGLVSPFLLPLFDPVSLFIPPSSNYEGFTLLRQMRKNAVASSANLPP